MMQLAPALDALPADWVQAGIRGFAESVLSLVPEGFAAYVRVFHPVSGERWSDIATREGTTVHPEMELAAVARSWSWQSTMPSGDLPPEVIGPLVEVIGGHTSTPGACWFAVWEGWGRSAQRADVVAAPTFALPKRRYHLMQGPVSAAAEGVNRAPFEQSASLWWPDDRAWLVATEVDLHSTYIGCTSECAAAIVSHAGLEAMAIDPSAGITFASDTVNPAPPAA